MTADLLAVAIRSALYLDLMLLFGGAAFRLHALLGERPVSGAVALMWGALAGILLSVLGLVALAASMSGATLATVESSAISLLLRETSVGAAGLIRIAALTLLALCALLSGRSLSATVIVVAASGIALGTIAWSGHGAMDGWLHLGTDVVHLLAAGIWLGALAALLRLAMRRTRDTVHWRAVHAALERFSAIGVAVVLLVLLSGIANGWFLVGLQVERIPASRWGQILLAKLALFLAMLALAAFNRYRLTPALGDMAGEHVTSRLRLSLALETGAAVLIVLLVAWLGMMEPPIA